MKYLLHFPAKKNVTEFMIPNGVEIINHVSFTYIIYLKHLIFPDSVTNITRGAFKNQISLEFMTAIRNYKQKEIYIHPLGFELSPINESSLIYVYSSLKPITCRIQTCFSYQNLIPFISMLIS